MSLLIDGYNLLHVSGILGRDSGSGSLQASRLAMLNFLAETLAPEDLSRTTIAFDANDAPPGLPRTAEHRGIRVQFASKHGSADELIEELIAADSAPRRLTVVSSDHRIQRAAKRRRARAVDSDVWYRELLSARRQREQSEAATPARPPVPLLAEDVNYWMRQFGGESVLVEFLQRESSERASGERESDKTGLPTPRESKAAKQAGPGKPVKQVKKTQAKRRRRAHKASSEKPASDRRLPGDIERLDNPFPPGYGDDLLGELY